MFTEENGYDASFAYSLKNDEQIAAAQKFIQDEVDYLLISAAGTSGWDSRPCRTHRLPVSRSSSLTAPSTLTRAFIAASIVSDMDKRRPDRC